MLFYPTRRGSMPVAGSRQGSPRPLATGETGDAMDLTWMLKSFVMGITLLGLSYWLVQIAGVQYLATLTSATLLAFLLAYVVWCLLHKNRHSRQNADSTSRMEAGNSNSMVGTTEPLTPTPPPPFDHHQAYKFSTAVPPRDCSPPPSYEEAIRAMLALTTSSPVFASPEPPPAFTRPTTLTSNMAPPLPSGLTPRFYSTLTQSSPTGLLARRSFLSTSPSAFRPSPPPALTPSPQSVLASSPQSALPSLPQSALRHSPTTDLMSSPPSALMPVPSLALTSTPSSSILSWSHTSTTPSPLPAGTSPSSTPSSMSALTLPTSSALMSLPQPVVASAITSTAQTQLSSALPPPPPPYSAATSPTQPDLAPSVSASTLPKSTLDEMSSPDVQSIPSTTVLHVSTPPLPPPPPPPPFDMGEIS